MTKALNCAVYNSNLKLFPYLNTTQTPKFSQIGSFLILRIY